MLWHMTFRSDWQVLMRRSPGSPERSSGWARAYLTGLLAPVERKNSCQLAEASGSVVPDGFQHFLNRACRSADVVRDQVRSNVVESLASPDGLPVVDEIRFIEKAPNLLERNVNTH